MTFCACAEHLIDSSNIQNDHFWRLAGGLVGGTSPINNRNSSEDVLRKPVCRRDQHDAQPHLPLTVIEYEEWGNPNTKGIPDNASIRSVRNTLDKDISDVDHWRSTRPRVGFGNHPNGRRRFDPIIQIHVLSCSR